MALNKYMHPRNLYKTPPDFAKLAKSFEEFSTIAKTDVTGKVCIDFKNPHCLRVLTKCLLKSDFRLDVVIPEDRLVPTLPLRLNYILWIEDLLNSIDRKDDIRGLDIGTGACAIYPLLAVAKNKWHMIGTESDLESLEKAQENVDRNNLKNNIQIRKNDTSSIFEYLFTEDNSQMFDFCMCNPPFYSNVEELCESRSLARLPPKNGFTGSPQELITEGGELTFCRKMIKESKAHKNKVLIFSTMVGHKFNMKELAQDLKADGINHTTTEFCQGRVTRWGLAWTYQEFDINKLVPARDKLRKKNKPVVYLLPELKDSSYTFQTVSEKLLDIMKVLQIKYKILHKKGNSLSLDVIAVENTWSNQRRKRRLIKMQKGDPKKPKLNEDSETVHNVSPAKGQQGRTNEKYAEESMTEDDQLQSKVDPHFTKSKDCNIISSENSKSEGNVVIHSRQGSLVNNNLSCKNNTHVISRESVSSESLENNNLAVRDHLVHAFFTLLKKDNDMLLEIEFLDGTSGKEGVHQILQYIKNNWKYFLV